MLFPQPGDAFDDGHYQLRSKLGEGGHAIVFRATERGAAERDVAIKVLKPGKNGYDAEMMARFDREVGALAQLRNPHSLTLYREGMTEDGLRFLVFEYVPGQDLARLLADAGKLSPAATVHVLRQLLSALHEAHESGLLHRDIKPENIRVFEYLGDPMRVKLLDFGIARRTESDAPTITQAGDLVGTPRYMSPEQLTDKTLGPPSDLYSLGMVAVEMLGGSAALQGRKLGDQIDRLLPDHVFSLDGQPVTGLTELLAKMCARDPRARFQTAQEVLVALDALERSPSTPPANPRRVAATANLIGPSRTDNERRGALILLAGGLIALLAITLVWGALRDSDAPPTRPPPPPRSLDSLLKSEPTANTREISELAPDADPIDAEHARELASGGCGRDAPFIGEGSLKRVDGLTALRWTVFVPKAYDPNVRHPVVLMFHQDVHTGRELIRQVGFDDLADDKGFIIIAPDGDSVPWRAPSALDSIGSMLQGTAAELCVDPTRVFAIGHGTGGMAVNALSCRPWLAGIAINSFRMEPPGFLCAQRRPIPLIQFAPMNSTRFKVEGGPGCGVTTHKLALDAEEKLWRERNHCDGQRTEYERIGDDVCYTWGCESSYVSCHLVGGHSWPGSNTREIDVMGCDTQLMEFPATPKIWEFFEKLDPNRDADPSTW